MTGLYHTLFPFLLDWSNSGGKTALHIAAQSGNSPFISLLLSYGADPDLTDLQGNSPLHYAAAWGHMEVARVLLDEGGAAWGIRNFEGFSAGDYAYSDEIRSGMESTWNHVKSARREKRRAESEGEMYGGESGGGISRNAALKNVITGEAVGNRWRSGSESTGASWIGSNSGASGGSGGGSHQTPSYSIQAESPASPHPARPRGNSRNTAGPPVTQHPRRPSPIKGHSSPATSHSGYTTPRYDPVEAISRSSSQSQIPLSNRARSPYQSQGPSPVMSRQGSNRIETITNGDTSQRSSPAVLPPSFRPPLLAPQISITTQLDPPTSTSNIPHSHEGYDYNTYAQPSLSSPRPQAPGRSPSLPTWQDSRRGSETSHTPAIPTAAGPPVATPASSQMLTQASSPAIGHPKAVQEGIKRSNSSQVGLGLGVGRALFGGRI